MISRDSVVVGTAPRITADQFEAILESASSPALVESQACFKAIVDQGIDPCFILAVFCQESAFGSTGFALANKSPGNTRSVRPGNLGNPVETVKGILIRYPTWRAGFKDLAQRLADPTFDYARAGAKTIGTIIPILSPESDGNQPEKVYIPNVIKWMNQWIGNNEVQPVTIQIDDRSGQLASGKSANRGNYSIDELILHETSGPHDVRNAAPDLARTLDDATISWFLTPRSDVSIHYLIGGENLGAPIYRLCPESQAAYHIIGTKGSVDNFSIDNHESIGIERMGQPNDNPGPNQTRALCELALDICKRNPRITPDRIFSHASLQPDRRDGNTLLAVVRQYVIDNLGSNHVSNNQPAKPVVLPYGVTVDPAGALIFPGNIPLNFGFKDAFLTLFGNVDQGDLGGAIMRGVKIFGLPVGVEVADGSGSSQDFELCEFRYNKNEAEGWKVRLYRDRKAA
jgi:hypothetical protein